MSNSRRRRKLQVPLRPIELERGSDRFSSKWRRSRTFRSDPTVPTISRWRENLTGLSHVHNIYSIAIGDEVWIYQPSFPLQKLGKDPVLKIRLPKSGRNVSGYMDELHPHNVNHLLVTFLGIEEILLVTCDDGDTIGFRVDEIQRAIERRLEPDSAENVYATDIRHFFLENVGKSSWGLAVHTEARKIAVSANTHNVTVFEFGLATDGDDEGEDEGEAEESPADEDKPVSYSSADIMRNSRKQDRSYVLPGQLQNIPCVTFCNTGEDPEGRFLACGDINGLTYIWDLLLRTMIEIDRLEFCAASNGPSNCPCSIGHHYPHSVWGLAWLSKAAFRKYPLPVEDILGCKGLIPEEKLLSRQTSQPVDASVMRTSVPNSVPEFVPVAARHDLGPNPLASSDVTDSEDDADAMDDSADVVDEDQEEDQSEVSDASSDRDTEQSSQEGIDDQDEDIAVSPAIEEDNEAEEFEDESDGAQEEFEDEEEVQVFVTTGLYPIGRSLEQPAHAKQPQYSRDVKEASSLKDDRFPQSPFLYLSLSDMFIMQLRGRENRPYPIIGVHEPFKQRVESLDLTSGLYDVFTVEDYAEYCDRISLHAMIPELGVVVVATPKGRAAVLALFQNYNKEARKTVYAFRMEWLLPTAEQEKEGLRPETMLIGLALSPIQGMLGEREQGRPRKWRLLMTYADHSVLSYEIRGADDEERDGYGRATKVDSGYDFFL